MLLCDISSRRFITHGKSPAPGSLTATLPVLVLSCLRGARFSASLHQPWANMHLPFYWTLYTISSSSTAYLSDTSMAY